MRLSENPGFCYLGRVLTGLNHYSVGPWVDWGDTFQGPLGECLKGGIDS